MVDISLVLIRGLALAGVDKEVQRPFPLARIRAAGPRPSKGLGERNLEPAGRRRR